MTTHAQQFAENGFLLVENVVPQELISRAAACIHRLAQAPPPPGTGPEKLRKMNDMHVTEPVIRELASHPAIGRLVAELTGAKMVQLFSTQTLVKPPGGAEVANVGWHQDFQYWHEMLQGELMTAWVAVSDVTPEAGPMRFVRGSHQWGLLNAGDFFSGNLEVLKAKIREKHGGAWEEVPAVLRPGGVSFHHKLTFHGSGANLSAAPRCSVAIHLRTEKSSLAPSVKFGDKAWLRDFADHSASPVLYGEGAPGTQESAKAAGVR